MRIKYKRQKYKVGLKDYICISALQWKLRINRILRLCRRVYESSKSVLIVFPFWVLFILISYLWGTSIGEVKNISELLWDFKTSIFTSIFLVFFLGVYNGQKMHTDKLEKQAYMYVSFMRDSEDVIKKLYSDCFAGQYEEDWCFYTNSRYLRLCNEIENNIEIHKNKRNSHKCIVIYLEVLKEFKDYVKNNGIVSWNAERFRKDNNEFILHEIENLYEKIKRLDCWDNGICKKDMLLSITRDMYWLIDMCRIPWRRDYIIDQIIRLRIYKNDERIMGEYYLKMFLQDEIENIS